MYLSPQLPWIVRVSLWLVMAVGCQGDAQAQIPFLTANGLVNNAGTIRPIVNTGNTQFLYKVYLYSVKGTKWQQDASHPPTATPTNLRATPHPFKTSQTCYINSFVIRQRVKCGTHT